MQESFSLSPVHLSLDQCPWPPFSCSRWTVLFLSKPPDALDPTPSFLLRHYAPILGALSPASFSYFYMIVPISIQRYSTISLGKVTHSRLDFTPLSGSLFVSLKEGFIFYSYSLVHEIQAFISSASLKLFLLSVAMIPILPDPRGVSQSEPTSSPWPSCSCPPSGSTFSAWLG